MGYGVTDPQVGDVIVWDSTYLAERRERVIAEVAHTFVYYEGDGTGSTSITNLANPKNKYRRKYPKQPKKKGFAAWVTDHS